MNRKLIILKILLIFHLINANNGFPSSANIFKSECPRLYPKVFKGYVPRGNISAGFYDEIFNANSMKRCVLKCCLKETCNVAFMTDDKCYHLNCNSNELCIPTLNLNSDTIDRVSMVLVKPTDDDTWEDVLAAQETSNTQIDREMYNLLNDQRRFEKAYKNLEKDMFLDNSIYDLTCDLTAENPCLLPNEICMPKMPGSMEGICECNTGYNRLESGVCALYDEMAASDIITERVNSDILVNKSAPFTRKQLTVVAESKKVRLPKDEVTLLVRTLEPEDPENKFQYEWTSLIQPPSSTAVKHQNGPQLHLEKLSEGIYEFKVSVSTSTAYGETFVNVTVIPEARINTPPNIIITPANQSIKQPNTAAVLDASSSTDDDGIISWHWELQQGPLGYQPELKDSPTLQLNDLTKPGNYTFKLTVTDTDKATSSDVANITVLAVTDYPPEANAGEDKIIYLPHNNITLNGSVSTDDHAIKTWEWIKSADDAQKTVDMQNTRTPYLQLSNLQEGMYTFMLKVTDSANQSSVAQVHVFVKPPTNKPPLADAGDNVTISLPQTWAIVDASNSTDDNKIVAYKWEQIEGPSTATFINANMSKTNITGLTKGQYIFKVSVTDDNKNLASDTVYVIVNQNQNQKPVANAGEDFTVELPINGLVINGSNSKDDWQIVKWKWTKADNSLAIGNFLEKTDESPVLIITDVAVGTYILNLTVFDQQGLSDTDSVTITVKNDPKLLHLVELTVDINAKQMTVTEFNLLKAKLSLLLSEDCTLQVRQVKPQSSTGKVTLTFYLNDSRGNSIPANDVVSTLRKKLLVDAKLMGFNVKKMQTAICQNSCSGHGICNELTRECECEVFWMHDMFKAYLNPEEDSDCSWSVLYVVLGTLTSILTLCGLMWVLAYLCYRLCHSRHGTNKPTNYKLIENIDDIPPFATRKADLIDSDTDSDVVFETRSKPPRYSDSRNGHKSSRNGYNKSNRRIKT